MRPTLSLRLQNPLRFEAALDSIYSDWYPRRQVRGEVTLWVRVDCDGRARGKPTIVYIQMPFRLPLRDSPR